MDAFQNFFEILDQQNLGAIRVRAGTKNSLPVGIFTTVGIVQKIRQTTTQLPPQTSSPWCSVLLMNMPN